VEAQVLQTCCAYKADKKLSLHAPFVIEQLLRRPHHRFVHHIFSTLDSIISTLPA
jgi:hypothetical protein